MTRLISFDNLRYVNSTDNAVYFSKDSISQNDLLIAQNENEEVWFNIQQSLDQLPLKSGYTMYILTKYEK